MKDIHILQVIAQVLPFIRAEDAHGQAQDGPEVNRMVFAFVMLGQVVDLRMAVMAGRDAVVRIRGRDLIVFDFAERPALLGIAGLKCAAPAAAAEVVGFIRGHVDEVFLAYRCLDHEADIIGCRIPIAFTDDLAGVL